MTAPRKVLTLPARQLALANARMVIRDNAVPLNDRLIAADWLVMYGDETDREEGRAAILDMEEQIVQTVERDARRADRLRLACIIGATMALTVAACWALQGMWIGG